MQKESIKGITIGTEETKLLQFADDTTAHKGLKFSSPKVLDVSNINQGKHKEITINMLNKWLIDLFARFVVCMKGKNALFVCLVT